MRSKDIPQFDPEKTIKEAKELAGYFNFDGNFESKERRKSEKSIEGINILLKNIEGELNSTYGPPDIIDKNGAIINTNQELETKLNNSILKFKKSDQSINEVGQNAEYKEGMIWEKIVTIVFNKILREDFIIVHSSNVDDVLRGFDTLIIDKKTGKTICTLDEVARSEENCVEKVNKIAMINQRFGGASMNNGLVLKGNTLVKDEVAQVPIFLLQITKKEFEEVLEKMDLDSMDNISEIEFNVFDKMIESLSDQVEKLLEGSKYNDINLIRKIKEFSTSLEDMKKIKSEKLAESVKK